MKMNRFYLCIISALALSIFAITASGEVAFEGKWIVSYAELNGKAVNKFVGKIVTITNYGDYYIADGPDGYCQSARFRLSSNLLNGTVNPPLDVLTELFDLPLSTLKQAGPLPYDITLTLSNDGRTIYIKTDGWDINWRGFGKEFASKERHPDYVKYILKRKD